MCIRDRDEVEELHPAAHIPLGDGHHQTQVGFGKALFGGHITLRHADGQLDLLLGGKKRHPPDLLEVCLLYTSHSRWRRR